jgi:hypothetical protein
VLLLIGSVAVVVGFGLPDASDSETLTEFADIKSTRIAEHFFYLGALMLFALHTLVLHRLLARAHPPAALFGTAVAEFGLVALAASSLLHVSTSPLADLYSSPETPSEDLPAIEYAWRGAQSVFDTMLATGLLLLPIGIVLLGVAMRRASAFGPRVGWAAITLGGIGVVGATVEVIDPAIEASAASLLGAVVLFVITGWRMLTLARA